MIVIPAPPALDVRNLAVSYQKNGRWLEAVSDVSLRIGAGEAYGLVGESGSGKTTLALAVMGYLPANGRVTGGQILLEGVDLASLDAGGMASIWQQRIKLVPQNPASSLNPSMRVGRQLAESLTKPGSKEDATQQVLSALSKVRIVDAQRVANSYPHQLSGGMQQRVLIAMALGSNAGVGSGPDLLILDEPTTNLDVTTEAVILDLVCDLATDARTAILYVSHSLAVVVNLCDRVAVLYAGELVEDLSTDALRSQPLHPYTLGILRSTPRLGQRYRLDPLASIPGQAPALGQRGEGCVFAARCSVALEHCFDQRPELEATPGGGMVRCHRWREIAAGLPVTGAAPARPAQNGGPSSADPVVTVVQMTCYFPIRRFLKQALRREPPRQVHAVDGIDLAMPAMRTLGLVGESGSGKTTAARCIIGLVERSSGDVSLHGVSLAARLEERDVAAWRQLQMVFQNPDEALNPHHAVGKILRRPLQRLMGLSQSEADREAVRLLQSVRLGPDYMVRTPGELSGGEKQRVAIARAFASNPGALILDESVSALDVSVQAAILGLLVELQAAEGSAFLFISHDLATVSYLADDIAVMYLGQIVEVGPTEQILTPPWHPYTEALLASAPRFDPADGVPAQRLGGELPSAIDLPTGCRFHTRCPRLIGDVCRDEEPPWQEAGPGHRYRCHLRPQDLKSAQLPAQAEQS